MPPYIYMGKRFLDGNTLDAGRNLVSATCTGQLASTLGGQSAYVLRQRAARTSVSRRRSITSMSTLSGQELHEYLTRIRARGQKPRHLP